MGWLTSDSRRTITALAGAGGAALLVGLAFFSWHALEQGWIAAGQRLVLGGCVAIALMIAAWPLAKRGHTAAAGALGGAGLGAWFSAWLVARYVHELVSAPTTFIALAIAAAGGLVLADRLQLRLMAALACVGACATPALTGTDRLSELMIHQLVVLAALVVLDVRRRWPELPTMGLVGTWGLVTLWAATHLEATSELVAWTVVLVVVTAASSWRIFTVDDVFERRHVAARLVVTGLAASGGIGWAFIDRPDALAIATVLLAAWHGGLAFALHRRRAPELARVVTWIAWCQTAAIPATIFTGLDAAVWWSAMAIAAAVATWLGCDRIAPRLVVLPTVCAIAWAAEHGNESWACAAGLVAAAIPLAVGVWPGPAREPKQALVWLGTASWIAIVVGLGPDGFDEKLLCAIVPCFAIGVRSVVRPTASAGLAVVHLAIAGLGVIAVALESAAFYGGPFPALLLATLLVLIGLGVAVITRNLSSTDVDVGGLVVATLVGLAIAIVVPQAVSWTHSIAAGRTIALALPGLLLVVAGLRLRRDTWRRLGLAAIAIAAAKVVLVDTAGASLIARASSFIGIGAILILGALAHGRAQRARS